MTARDDAGDLARARKLINVLNAQNIRCWIDSGTLLGLHRDGKLIPGDNDLDIGAVALDATASALIPLEDFFPDYRINRYFFDGRMVKLKAVPVGKERHRTLDVVFYRSESGLLISPGLCDGGLAKSVHPLVQTVRTRLKKWYFSASRGRINIRTLVHLGLGRLGTWSIPSELVIPCALDQRFALPVPPDIDDYLEFRYGNWSTPNCDWVFWRDDGAFKLDSPV